MHYLVGYHGKPAVAIKLNHKVITGAERVFHVLRNASDLTDVALEVKFARIHESSVGIRTRMYLRPIAIENICDCVAYSIEIIYIDIGCYYPTVVTRIPRKLRERLQRFPARGIF